MLRKAFKYMRDGTLGARVKAQLRGAPAHLKVRWYGADSTGEAFRGLLGWAERHVEAGAGVDAWILCLGARQDTREELLSMLTARGIQVVGGTPDEFESALAGRSCTPAAIICSDLETADITAAAEFVSGHAVLGEVPFEYAEGAGSARQRFSAWDEYAQTFFVSPVLRDKPDPYEIYQQSLNVFEQKCGIRDYLDLYQMLRGLGDRGIDGCIAEFGSYKGHSGWLIAESLKQLGDTREVNLFDMFEHFPDEGLGIDKFWSQTHRVDFDKVKAKFDGQSRVRLVKGDFTRTLAETDIGPVALAYVDCDSFRATRYLFEKLLRDHLVPGGVLICEDYGHPALLGSRVAVHEVLEGRTDLIRFYSQFSGLYIAVKTGD